MFLSCNRLNVHFSAFTTPCRLYLLLLSKKNISKICFDKLSYSAYELFIKTSKYRWDMAARIFQALSNCLSWRFRSSCSNVFYEKGVLKILVEFTGKHLCRVLFFNKVAGWKSETSSDRETPAHVFSCEF